MDFKTQYDARDRIFSCPGSREHVQYAGHYDERGRVVLEETGRINTYDEIQSHADSCDIHTIMRRYNDGDFSALSLRQGFYADVTDFPKTYAEALNRMSALEDDFFALAPEVRKKFNNSFSEFLAASMDADFLGKLGMVAPAAAIPDDKEEESE